MGKSAFSTRLVGTVPEPALANLEDSTSELNEAFIGAQLKFTDLAGDMIVTKSGRDFQGGD
eukprot:scaffold89167_cov22-Tisochrysis_lutea.AAC.1